MKRIGKEAGVCLVSLAVVLVLAQSDFMINLDNWASDIWHIWRGERNRTDEVILVAVDEKTIERLADPIVFWSPHFATVIHNLNSLGATAIGVDFLFRVSVEDWLDRNTTGGSEIGRTFDVSLRRELAGGKVVLASALSYGEDGNARLTLPNPGLLYALPDAREDTGATNFYIDSDGVIRRWTPYFGPASDPYLTFALALVLKHKGLKAEDLSDGLEVGDKSISLNSRPSRIIYQGPPGAFPRISFLDLWVPDAAEDPELARAVKGRIAIIGSDFSVAGDNHVTPYNRTLSLKGHRLMAGMEVHANIVASILSPNRLVQMPSGVRLAIFLVAALALAHLWNRISPFKGLGWLSIAIASFMAGGYLLFAKLDTILPAASGALLLICVYGGTYILRLTHEERMREYVRQAFNRYVSRQVVDLLLKDVKKIELTGQEMPVAILFGDIRNFTTLSENVDPKEVVEILNSFFERICPPILKEGGTIDKFMGDGIMALFGAPVTYTDHVDRALRATASIVSELKKIQGLMKEKGIPDFDIGVGLHCGHAVVGDIGSSNRRDYTAIGDDVNVAARVETLTRDLNVRVLITAAVVEASGIDIRVGEGSSIPVKGRRETVRVYPLLEVDGNSII